MKEVFSKAITFIKENLSVIYTLFLLILIPAAFLANNYLTNSSYEKNIDQITQRKAILAENIVNSFINGNIENTTFIQKTVEKITKENPEILPLSVLKNLGSTEGFQIIASSDLNLIGKNQNEQIQNILAWNRPEGIAYLDYGPSGRFWKVTKTLTDSSNNKAGLIETSFSLTDSDALVARTVSNSYWILIITILIIVLLVSNQVRLFGYALTANKLKEVDKMKDMFISMASHELRSPLTVIKGYLDMIKTKKDLKLDSETTHFLDVISLSTNRLNNLVEDVLEVSRLEGNRLPMDMVEFDPRELIEQTVEEMRIQASQKNLNLTCSILKGPLKIKADIARLKQVLVNLLSNSIKYTQKGSVDVNVTSKKGELLIIVADTGIGISSEDQANLFQRFYRVKNDQTSAIIGTGLGLWITLEIVKKMGGKIKVESIEGVGSHFTAHFPIIKS